MLSRMSSDTVTNHNQARHQDCKLMIAFIVTKNNLNHSLHIYGLFSDAVDKPIWYYRLQRRILRWRVNNELKQRRHAVTASAKSKRGKQRFWTSAGVVVWAKIRTGHLPNTNH